jgi:hypothetical protein
MFGRIRAADYAAKKLRNLHGPALCFPTPQGAKTVVLTTTGAGRFDRAQIFLQISEVKISTLPVLDAEEC